MNTYEKKLLEQLTKNKAKNIVIFGGSAVSESSAIYKKAYEVSHALVNLNYTIITGSGTGVMEASNKAAINNSVRNSIGFKVNFLPQQPSNNYLHKSIVFNTLHERKEAFYKTSNIFLCFPGGIGSLDELISFLALIQCAELGEEKRFLLVDLDDYWKGLFDWIKAVLIKKYQFANLKLINSIKRTVSEKEIIKLIH